MATVLVGGAVLTMDADNRLLPVGDVRIDGTDIVAIGANLTQPEDTILDCRDALVMPGLVNVHTHAGTAMFRGLVEDVPRSFWAGYRMPRQERWSDEDYVTSARLACAEFLLNGVTCIADRLGSMNDIAPAIEASGIRAVVGDSISDAAPDWRATEALLERYGTDPRRRVSAGVAPHALDTCSDALLKECAARAEKTGARIVIHVAQSEAEVASVRARGHDGALACLISTGLIGGHVVAAHCIYLTPAEIDAWPRHGVSLAHCPASNLKIEARTAPLHRFAGNVPVGLGTDWTASNNGMDLLGEARLAALVGKMLADDPTVLPVRTMLRMLTIEGARVLGLDRVTGSIEVGKRADLVVLDLSTLEANPRHDLCANVLYSMSRRSVRDVLVDGQILVRAGRLTCSDEAAFAERSRALGDRL
jgi:5-methylthioadenosine/S-adenosylhomocysteine deaminase